MMIASQATRNSRWSKSGNWIPWVFAAGMLAAVAANGALVYFAFRSWTGVSAAHAYQRGLDYNRVLAVAAREEALGWQASVAIRRSEDLPDHGEVVLHLRDREGRPLDGVRLVIELVRPLEALPSIPVPMVTGGAGRYTGALETLPRAGQWDVRLAATRGEDAVHIYQRVFLP